MQKSKAKRKTAKAPLKLSHREQSKLFIALAKEKEADIKRTVINALFTQGNADSLVAIARKETDPALKREVVSKLSLMTKSKVAMDYLMEILNK